MSFNPLRITVLKKLDRNKLFEENPPVESEEEPTKSKKTEEKQENSNPIVRVTKDIPEFIGTDEKKYNLRNNDIISLPKDMSDMLSKRGAVKKIEQ